MGVTTISWTATRIPFALAEKKEWYTQLNKGRLPGMAKAELLPGGDVLLPGYTFNLWWGCVEVGPGCDHCYARTMSNRFGFDVWGKGNSRRWMTPKYLRRPVAWNERARRMGVRLKVFCGSMFDVAEHYRQHDTPVTREMNRLREEVLWPLIESTPYLDWLLLTKRPHNLPNLVPSRWMRGAWPDNAWVGATTENQTMFDRRVPQLAALPSPVRFLSYEPALECVNFDNLSDIHWLIIGGESGPGARSFDPSWAKSAVRQGRDAGVAVFVKQMGEVWAKEQGADNKKGEDWNEWPESLRVREWPR